MRKTVKKDIVKIDEDIKNYLTLLETLDKESIKSKIKLFEGVHDFSEFNQRKKLWQP